MRSPNPSPLAGRSDLSSKTSKTKLRRGKPVLVTVTVFLALLVHVHIEWDAAGACHVTIETRSVDGAVLATIARKLLGADR